MKKRNYFIILALSLIMLFGSIFDVQAATNVTKKLPKEEYKKIVSLNKNFVSPAGYKCTYKIKKNKSATYNFDKENVRRDILSLATYNTKVEQWGASRASQYIFGTSTSKVKLMFGDWGETEPRLKNIKVYKVNKTKYKVKADLCFYDYTNGKTKKYGTYELNIQKKSDSHYGYVAKSLKVKRN